MHYLQRDIQRDICLRVEDPRVEPSSGVDPEPAQGARAEDSLRESDQRFCAMADAAPVMIWMSGVDMLCNFFNEPWLAFTGHDGTGARQRMGGGGACGRPPALSRG